MTSLILGRAETSLTDEAMRREWLVTNGIGGFASGTLALANSRCYHALLLAALEPPLGRTVLVAKVDVTATYDGRTYRLSSNEYADGAFEGHGYRQLETFRLEGLLPVWTFSFGDALLEQRIFMRHGENSSYLTLSLTRSSSAVTLELRPLCTYRDYHAQGFGGDEMTVETVTGGFEVRAGEGLTPYRVLLDKGEFQLEETWTETLKHRIETERGLNDEETLYSPGAFTVTLQPGERVTLLASTEPLTPHAGDDVLRQGRARQHSLLAPMPELTPDWIRQLVLAADQFIVARGTGQTVLAGYPWFTDWGRDTMIALPGLTLATRRPEVARSILRTFAKSISKGMIPNRFPDQGDVPEYNTVDATLWFFVALYLYYRDTGDSGVLRELYPNLLEILTYHRHGTRYRIGVDPEDGLLFAGEAGVQLTWMDVKVEGEVITPRIGKPVEINALYYNALRMMAEFARAIGEDAKPFTADAARVRESFGRFLYAEGGYLYDVIDGPEGERGEDGRLYDSSLRPNQLFALSLPFGLLEERVAKGVLEVCARKLYTSHGLRSLAPEHPAYAGQYGGGRVKRDRRYHQGTVWGWLIGTFVSAHYRIYGDRDAALGYLEPFRHHLRDGCLGQLSEVFDAEAPHLPRGCPAQAWTVAEVLRVWAELQ